MVGFFPPHKIMTSHNNDSKNSDFISSPFQTNFCPRLDFSVLWHRRVLSLKKANRLIMYMKTYTLSPSSFFLSLLNCCYLSLCRQLNIHEEDSEYSRGIPGNRTDASHTQFCFSFSSRWDFKGWVSSQIETESATFKLFT